MASDNVLTEVAWIPTAQGLATPQEVLLGKRPGGADPWVTEDLLVGSGYQTGSVLRFLVSVMAVAQRYWNGRPEVVDPNAINRAIEELSEYAHLQDPEKPFMQRLTVEKAEVKEVKKLDPSITSDQAEAFWNFSMEKPKEINFSQAALALVQFHYYSPVGNSLYDGKKPKNGSPGFRFPGKNNTATEVFWRGENLHETLIMNLPKNWISGNSLPAWADRTAEKSDRTHPLWRATWSSNVAACYWSEEGMLTGVGIGGVPEEWYPYPKTKKKYDPKEWWDLRNIEDPFYLYKEGEKTPQRLDIGKDATELAVTWNAEGNAARMRRNGTNRLLPAGDDSSVFFLRHLIGGTGSSPVIRASEIFSPYDAIWNPPEQNIMTLQTTAETIQEFNRLARAPFTNFKEYPDIYIKDLRSRQREASTTFWRLISPSFGTYVKKLQEDITLEDYYDFINELGKSVITTFDRIVAPSLVQLRSKIEVARSRLVRRTYGKIKEIKANEEGTD